MNKLVRRCLKGALVVAIATTPITANAFGADVEKETSQAIFEQSVSGELATAVPVASKVVLTDKTGVKVLDTVSGSKLSRTLKASGYSLKDYRTEEGKPAQELLVVGNEPVFLFKMEYKGSSSRLKITAPVTKLQVNGIPAGTTIVQDEGTDGVGLLTTVTSHDLSRDKQVNSKSPARGHSVTKTETLTVVKSPQPRVELVGTTDAIAQAGDYEPIEGECTNGTSVPTTVSPDIIAIQRAVCIQFPDVYSYGTYRSTCPITCDHHDGKALDIMVSGEEGWLIAQYLTSTASMYDINYLIYEQQIWEPERPYWRKMEDRGSITANHFDHVHVSVNSNGIPYSTSPDPEHEDEDQAGEGDQKEKGGKQDRGGEAHISIGGKN